MPKRGARLSFSWGRLPGNHGRKRSFSECALVSKSYRTPRFSVTFLLAFQSSCSQPAKKWRTTLYRCSVSEVEWKTKRVMEASGARFHVDASFQTGKSDSRFAGGATLSAWITPSHRKHQRNSLWYRKYSPPSFRSCRPNEVVRSSRIDCVSCRMLSGLAPIV